jgi:uncharacterized protein involved in exopolysaccharide biosynthesis
MAGLNGSNVEEWQVEAKEIDVRKIAGLLLKRKFWILGTALAFTALGAVYSLVAPPVYHSEAIITPKDPSKSAGAAGLIASMSGIGGLGGIAAQFGFGNNNLDQLEVIAESHDLAAEVITEKNLLPILFYKKWDESKKSWKCAPEEVPDLDDGIEKLQRKVIDISVNTKKGIMTIAANFHDSTLAAALVTDYLEALNRNIQSNVRAEAESNQKFLEEQLNKTSDPLVREKIQTLMGSEIEKAMLASNQSFTALALPFIPNDKSAPKGKIITAAAGFFGLMLSIFLILIRAQLSGAFHAREPSPIVASRTTTHSETK